MVAMHAPSRSLRPFEVRFAALAAEVGVVLTQADSVSAILQHVAAALVRHLDVTLARIWTAAPESETLELQASAGLYTHIDGAHARIVIGRYTVGRIAADRMAYLSNDVTGDPNTEDREWARREGIVAFAGYPLVIEGRLAGVVAMFARHPFQETTLEALKPIAAQIAQCIERKRVENALRHHIDSARSMVEVARAVASSLDLQAVLGIIVERACQLLRCPRSGIAVVETAPDAGGVVRFIATRGLSREFVTRMRPRHWRDGATASAIMQRRSLWSSDVLNDPEAPLSDASRAVVEAEGFRASLAAPLVVGDRVLGALAVYRDQPGPFSADDVDLIEMLAAQAAIAMDNARLYEDAERRRREAEVVADLAREINASLDLDTVLMRVAEGARVLCAADMVRIALRPPGTVAATFRCSVGADVPGWRDVAVEPGKGSGGWVLANGRAFRTDDYRSDPRITGGDVEMVACEGTVSAMVVPIRGAERVDGLLYVMNRSQRPFTDRDEAVLLRLAEYARTAIQNARLYEELRTAKDHVERQQLQLVQSERLRAVGEMAAGVAHDFNNLLAVILGRTELLLRRVKDPDVRRGLDAIRMASQDGADTVRRIQEFTRTRTVRPLGQVELGDVVHEVVELTRPTWEAEAQSRGIRYDVVIEGQAGRVVGRPEELREVIANLMRNALEAMPGGGRCTITLGHRGGHATVAVTDTGTGMSESTRRRVFEPFFTTKGPRGTGLGLSVSWGIVTRHGGTLDVASTAGQGSTFTIKLPIATEAQATPPLPVPTPLLRKARILVVDDEPGVRAVLVDMLTAAGHEVVEAGEGNEALTKCDKEAFDVVLTDISMPGLSGWDVAETVRKRFPSLPVGLVTGWGDQLDADRLSRCAVSFVIAKPFRADDVLHELTGVLGSPA
jgi:signal transduction histidine kinase/CheY-like chemotaxis protein